MYETDITIDNKAKEYLNKKGIDTLTVRMTRMTSGWCSGALEPEVQADIPNNKQNFEEKYVQNYTVYLQKSINPSDPEKPVKISIAGFWFLKKLKVLNVDIITAV